jgi:hypothetical protein
MMLRLNKLPVSELAKAGGVGIMTALLLTAVMVPAMKLGFSPMPKPLGLAFAETVLGRALPLPVGLLFHIVYVAQMLPVVMIPQGQAVPAFVLEITKGVWVECRSFRHNQSPYHKWTTRCSSKHSNVSVRQATINSV